MQKAFLVLLSLAMVCSGCATIEYQPDWMDSPATRDPSVSDPTYRVSTRALPAGSFDPDKPVVIAVHGYSGSTYDWDEFRDYAEGKDAALVSLVLLGGHGTDIEDFKKATWQDWQKPVIEEYNALKAKGFKNINVVCASMGAALFLEALMNGKIAADSVLNEIVFIDPFIIPTDKNLYLIDVAGIFITNVPYKDASPEENRHSYVNRPAVTLMQLKSLALKVEEQVGRGYTLPAGVNLTVYKVKVDEAADPKVAAFLEAHIRGADGVKPEIHMLDTNLHVFTRIHGRAVVTEADKKLQSKAFEAILAKLPK